MSTSPKSPHRQGRLMASVAGAVTLSLFAAACGSDADIATADPVEQVTDATVTGVSAVLSAADGASARASQQIARGGIGTLQASALSQESTSIAGDFTGDCDVPYEPSAEELAEANADSDALAAVLDTFGVAYERSTDDLGFTYVQTDYTDVVAQSVVDSFWQNRFPIEFEEPVIEPIGSEELALQAAENDALVAALEAVGAEYTRNSDDAGWEWIEWDYENVDASDAIDAVYAELYPPIPPSAAELASMKADNDKVAAAFDAAGIAFTRVSDESGWEWVEWDYEDNSIRDAVSAVFDELYPVEPGLPCAQPLEGDLAAVSGVADDALVVDAEATSELAPEGLEPISVGDEFTAEQIAQRDTDVQAMATGFGTANVDFEVFGESPWASVTFDIENDDAIAVVTGILTTRG